MAKVKQTGMLLILLVAFLLTAAFCFLRFQEQRVSWSWELYAKSAESGAEAGEIWSYVPTETGMDVVWNTLSGHRLSEVNRQYLSDLLGNISYSYLQEYGMDSELTGTILQTQGDVFAYQLSAPEKEGIWRVLVSCPDSGTPVAAVEKED